MLQLIISLALSQIAVMATFRLFPVLTSAVNLPAMHGATLLRRRLHLTGAWQPGVVAGAVMIGLGRGLTSFLVPAAVFTYFEVPDREAIKTWVAVGAGAALLFIWMPGMFVLALAASETDSEPEDGAEPPVSGP